ncbi:ATP-binding protein [Kamptonema sp. PCC 6506]|uniref:ATP-binding protein n=1 Tax=Kamptonema sp. PCC 6506 TaxID=272129 RepID=UPI0001DAC2E7|nr:MULTISPECIES: ATP-binding protein [Kamptonema]CBN57870.1 hypothetical protein OSCI_3530037 [Kamptonema sp. PCC 6506]
MSLLFVRLCNHIFTKFTRPQQIMFTAGFVLILTCIFLKLLAVNFKEDQTFTRNLLYLREWDKTLNQDVLKFSYGLLNYYDPIAIRITYQGQLATQSTIRDITERKRIQQELELAKVRQVLLNLLSNAAKFSKEGTITLSGSRKQGDGEIGRRRNRGDGGNLLPLPTQNRLDVAYPESLTLSGTKETEGISPSSFQSQPGSITSATLPSHNYQDLGVQHHYLKISASYISNLIIFQVRDLELVWLITNSSIYFKHSPS